MNKIAQLPVSRDWLVVKWSEGRDRFEVFEVQMETRSCDKENIYEGQSWNIEG